MRLEGISELAYLLKKIAFSESISDGSDVFRFCISFRRGTGAVEVLWTIWSDMTELIFYGRAPAFYKSKEIVCSLWKQQWHRRHATIHCLGEGVIVVWLEGQPAMVRRRRKR